MQLFHLKQLILLLVIGVFFMNCNNDNNSKQNDKDNSYILPSMSFKINEADIPKFEREALLGSPESAFKLYEYYLMYCEDSKTGLYWQTIAAENGHPSAQHNLAYDLSKKTNTKDKLRARFWAKKAVDSGSKSSLSLLKEIESMK